ncbi:hypothetical protein MBM_01372 [Drepanopeziza brunnea f. sp. 'multigermtubi' MB_m1]|uniref:Uncharacterized protein n=1 Tax=Marssonina brunnea f. sp. multigermtubi (strain MB_m1) TaxID=1072389 RepID=K1WSU7_MARBU|nr:uncharacterized protein MBM_01372 [Drepanopeziza brunnea f. sp. 'multigermtubi' MB_m1]EKD20690.1 hypothetical protein MBM_01372 [Drepanopeziza brunnea f. sp. 'multigermtubi' MB_m1]
MQFFKSALSLSALLMLASALSVERNVLSSGDVQAMPHVIATNFKAYRGPANNTAPPASSFGISATGCDAEDEADCKEFCHLSEQTANRRLA